MCEHALARLSEMVGWFLRKIIDDLSQPEGSTSISYLKPAASGRQLHMHWYGDSKPRGQKYAINLSTSWIIIQIYIYIERIYICVFIIYWFYICSIFLIYLLYELPNGLRHGKCTAHDHCLQNASNVLVYDLWVNFPPFPTTSCLDLPSLTNRPANSRGAHGRTSTLAITASATNFIATRHQQLQPVPLPTLNTCTLPMQASPAT